MQQSGLLDTQVARQGPDEWFFILLREVLAEKARNEAGRDR